MDTPPYFGFFFLSKQSFLNTLYLNSQKQTCTCTVHFNQHLEKKIKQTKIMSESGWGQPPSKYSQFQKCLKSRLSQHFSKMSEIVPWGWEWGATFLGYCPKFSFLFSDASSSHIAQACLTVVFLIFLNQSFSETC